MKKSDLKKMVNHAQQMVLQHKGIEICFNIHSGSIYILDTEEDNIIDISRTEEDAIQFIKGINEESGFDTGCYYKPILIDSITGERITRKTIDNYKK